MFLIKRSGWEVKRESFTFPRWVVSLLRGMGFLFFYKNPVFILEWYINSKTLEYRISLLKIFFYFIFYLSFFVTYGEYGSSLKHHKVFTHIPFLEKRKKCFLKFLSWVSLVILGREKNWKFLTSDPQQHNFVIFNLKLEWLLILY